MSNADAAASPSVIAATTFVLRRATLTMPKNSSGQMTYHCSSIASDHMCRRGDGAPNCAK